MGGGGVLSDCKKTWTATVTDHTVARRVYNSDILSQKGIIQGSFSSILRSTLQGTSCTLQSTSCNKCSKALWKLLPTWDMGLPTGQ